jgi:transcriptional regulator
MSISSIRKAMGITKDQRIGQYIWNQLNAHDLIDVPEGDRLYFLEDDVFVKVLETNDFATRLASKISPKNVA